MRIKDLMKSVAVFAFLTTMTAGIVFSQPQKFQNPRKEKLLNGLNVLIWNTPAAKKVTVKLRIHRGAAFDPQNKEGTMNLMANILFPNQASREYFEQDLGGSLNITSNFDYLQLDITADNEKALDVLQTLANAISNVQIDKETTDLVRTEQLEKVRKLESDPAYIADKAVAERLLGDFPYGRAEFGTTESLKNIDFADLLFTKLKFFTSDSATLVIEGPVNSDLVYRAVRRFFGGWVKADSEIPATFRLPEAPDKNLKIIDATRENTSELRFAIRGVARNDKSFYAAEIIKNLLLNRVKAKERGEVTITSNSHLLPGLFIIAVKDWNLGYVKRDGNQIALPAEMNKSIAGYFADPITTAEFNSAKNSVLKRFSQENLTENWLDVETFKLSSFSKDMQAAQEITLEDVRTLAEKMKNEPVASVLVFQNPKPAVKAETSNEN